MIRSILLGTLLCVVFQAFSCDQCGCSLLSGVQPFERTNNFGLQFRMRYLHGELLTTPTLGFAKHGGHLPASTTAASTKWTELYYALEARGRFWLSKRISAMAAIPLVNNYQAVDGITRADLFAVGDPLVMVRYELLNNAATAMDTTTIRHRLTIGAGAKVPLGRTDATQFGETLDHDLQPGTGTWDALFSLEYQMRGTRWGCSLGAMARSNGTASDGHRFGHGGSATLEVFRVLRSGAFQWYPSVGTYTELAGKDRTDGTADPGTGGTVVFTHVGSRIWWRRIGLYGAWQHAVLRDKGALMVPDRERVLLGLTYNFGNG